MVHVPINHQMVAQCVEKSGKKIGPSPEQMLKVHEILKKRLEENANKGIFALIVLELCADGETLLKTAR